MDNTPEQLQKRASGLIHEMELYLHDPEVKEEYLDLSEKNLGIYAKACQCKNAKFYSACNTTVPKVYAQYDAMARFSYFKHYYYHRLINQRTTFSDVKLSPEERELHRRHIRLLKQMPRSFYIFHINMMDIIYEEVKLFFELGCMTGKDIRLIANEYELFLNYLEKICELGYWPETNKDIDIYYSDTLLPNDLILVDSEELQVGLIVAFGLNPVVTTRMETFGIIRNWFYGMIRTCKLISRSGEQHRKLFFEKQLEALMKLRKLAEQIL